MDGACRSAVRRPRTAREVRDEEGRGDSEVHGDFDPGPASCPEGQHRLWRDFRLSGQEEYHRQFVVPDVMGMTTAYPLVGHALVIADGQVKVPKAVPVEDHSTSDLPVHCRGSSHEKQSGKKRKE